MEAATKGYVDSQMAGALPKTGGTLSDALTLAGDPSASLHAATKHYVDTQVATSLPIAGGTMTGPVTLFGNPTTALHAASKQYVDGQVAGALPTTGGTLTGTWTLAGDPTAPFQAATRRYVDSSTGGGTGVINVRAAPYNALLNGSTDDTAAFRAAYQAAPAGSVIYVPNGVTVLQPPSNWGMPVTKRVKWIVDGTTLADGTPLSNTIPGGGGPTGNYLPGIVVGNSTQSAEFSQNGSQGSDFAVVHSSYVVNHSAGSGGVIANNRTDTIIYNSPANYVWGGVDRLLWCGTQTPNGFGAAEHVGRYVQTIRQSITNGSNGRPLPQPNLWAACLEYRDTTGQPSSSAASSITVEMDWFGNGPDDGSRRQIQSLVIGQNTTSGAPVEVSTILGVWLAAGSSGRAYTVFNINVPFSTSVLDTLGHLVSGRFPPERCQKMDKQQNIEARPGDAERPQEFGAASPGRGGRMSRQRKAAAVLRLLRGEDLETVSRSLGVTAATLSGWRDAFLAAGEAALATKSATGEELESDRLKAKLGAALIERDLLHEKIAVLEANRPLSRRTFRP